MLLRKLLIAGAAAVTGLVTYAVVVPAASAAEAPSTHAIYNDPTGDDAAKSRIFTRLQELIDGAATGSTIRASWYYADNLQIPNALIAAQQRGVNVQIIADSEQKTHATALNTLTAALGTDASKSSFFIMCPDNRGCIADKGTWSINHNKFYLFTSTLGTANVVFQTTSNISGVGWRDGGLGWNDAMEVTGNDALFNSYTGYFGDLKAMKVNNNYYDTRVPLQAGTAKVFYYPRDGSSVDGDPGENTVMTMLNNTACFGNTTVGTSDNHRTIIRITTMEITLQYLADKLVALDAAGCYVEVNLRVDPSDATAVSVVKSMLKKTSSVYNGLVVRYYCVADPIWIHSKNFEIEGNYYGKGDRKIAWTGSLNWAGGSLRGDDEIMLQEENAGIFDTYKAQYAAVAAAATHKPANGDAFAC
jgi:hypothetical protein